MDKAHVPELGVASERPQGLPLEFLEQVQVVGVLEEEGLEHAHAVVLLVIPIVHLPNVSHRLLLGRGEPRRVPWALTAEPAARVHVFREAVAHRLQETQEMRLPAWPPTLLLRLRCRANRNV